MTRNMPHLLSRLVVILLFCVLVTLLFAANIAERNVAAEQASSHNQLMTGPISSQAACYTLDTSRPEWLQPPSIYLPLIIRDHAS